MKQNQNICMRDDVIVATYANFTKTIILMFLCHVLLPNSASALTGTGVARTHGGENKKGGVNNIWSSYGLTTYLSYSSDYTSAIITELADVSLAGTDSAWNTEVWTWADGLGVEPMAHAHAVTEFLDSSVPYKALPFAEANAVFTVRHIVRAKPELPGDIGAIINSIPLRLSFHVVVSSSDPVSPSGKYAGGAWAYIGIQGPGIDDGRSVNYDDTNKSLSGTITYNPPYEYGTVLMYNITASAGASAGYEYAGEGEETYATGGWGQATADPFLYIDPSWEYAQYFEVLQESSLHPDEWVPVTRMWQNPPTPISDVLTFFDENVENGTLVGLGKGGSANKKSDKFRNMLVNSYDLLAGGDIPGACQQLLDAMTRCDGIKPPPDYVEGEAVYELYGLIDDLRVSIGCPNP